MSMPRCATGFPTWSGSRTSINVAMDWTDFDADGQATIMLSLLTRHGRATPLLWLTVDKSTLKNRRNEYEYQALVRLADALPADIKVCIVADRGFGDQKLYRVLTEELKFDYVIRFRGNITVTARGRRDAHRRRLGWTRRTRARPARRPGDGRSLSGRHRAVCAGQGDETGLVSGHQQHQGDRRALMTLYGKRWGIECGLRDTKDLRFGMGMGSIHVSTPERRDRLWLLNAFAIALLTLLGAAGEALGYDRYLKSNTTKRRTHSLFRQGCMLYELIPTMPEVRLLPLVERFAEMLAEIPVFADTFGAV